MIKVYNWLKGLPFYLFIPLVLGVELLLSYFMSLIGVSGNNEDVFSADTELGVVILTGSFLAPLLETLIFQTLPIELILKFKPTWKLFAVFVSALLFSLIHIYSVGYVIYTFVLGVIMAFAYIVSRDKRDSIYAYLIVFAIHAIWNTAVTVSIYCF